MHKYIPSIRRFAPLAVCWLAWAAPPAVGEPAAPRVRFEEIGERAGVRFVHSTRKFVGYNKSDILEMFTDGGAAVAVGDYNGDGFDDLYVTDSDTGKPNHLMRNNGDLTFTDVAVEAGVAGGNDPMAIVADATWFDYDNDGLPDLLVSRFGPPILYHNDGPDADGAYHFTDVSAAAGVNKFINSIAAVTFDADNDGWLDLLSGGYFRPINLLADETPHVLPNNFDYAVNGGGAIFWRNVALADGSRGFVEETAKAGFGDHNGWTLDLGHGDLNNDGLQDVYFAVDYGTDRLFFNQGGGVFKEVTVEALGGEDTRKGMNVDMADYNRDGWLDVYVTNVTDEYIRECNMLWNNNGDGTLTDLSRETGACDSDWGWGAKFGDFDNDGWEDLVVVCGLRSRGEQNYIPLLLEVIITPGIDFTDINNYPDIGNMSWSGYQKQRFFHNRGDGTFRESGADVGIDNDLDGRGIGVGDFDNDGLLDFYQTAVNQPALLFHGRSDNPPFVPLRGNPGNWLEIKLIGTRSNRDAIGARVIVTTSGESWMREVNGGNGYSSSSTKRVHFGLGSVTAVDSVEIRWPSGLVEKLTAGDDRPPVPINAFITIREGEGVVKP
ncbi:MAG: CRTAC1 family protein [bacterium]|nr:CRTAC1 family protein [bacterium]